MMKAMMNALWQILALCRKEFLALLKDPANRVTLLVPALLQSMLFGYAATYDLNHVPYAVLDQSHGTAATSLLARLDGSGVFERVRTLRSASDIAPAVDDGGALLVLVIPDDFDARLVQGQPAPLQVILDGRNSSTALSISRYLADIVAGLNETYAGIAPRVSMAPRMWYNPNHQSRWVIMPALVATLSLMQTLLIAALSVAREREQGTFEQLLIMPLAPVQIMIAKAIPAITVGIVQATLVLLIVRFWFEVPMVGSVWLLYVGLLVFTTAAVGIGLSVSALSLTMQQAMLYTFMLIMPLILLSGMLTPVTNMPYALQVATHANPLRFGIEILRRVYLEGAVLAEVAPAFVPLFIMAFLTLPFATWLFRNRLA